MCAAWGLAERRGLIAFVPSVSPLFKMQGVSLGLESDSSRLWHGVAGEGFLTGIEHPSVF